MRGDSQNSQYCVRLPSITGHRFKRRGTKFKDVRARFIFAQSGVCLNRAARGRSAGRYDHDL